MGKVLAGRSLAFRLWLSLTLLAGGLVVALAAASSSYLISRDIEAQRNETHHLFVSVLEEAARRQGAPPSESDVTAAKALGVLAVEFYESDGTARSALPPGAPANGSPSDDLLVRVRAGERVDRSVKLSGDLAIPTAIDVLAVLRGGPFAQEFWVHARLLSPLLNEDSVARILLAREDLTPAARATVLVTVVVTAAAFAVTGATLWLLVDAVISRPLRRFSHAATRVAESYDTRLPELAGSELAELSRAVNHMAKELRSQAIVDALTGLYNLRHLHSRLEALVAEAAHAGEPLAVLVGDLDRFKNVNDQHGHASGDLVLKAVATAIQSAVLPFGVTWRLGGDEFVVGLPGGDGRAAAALSRGIAEAVRALRVETADGAVIRPSISLGFAVFPEDGDSHDALLRVADVRMYAAKARLGGRRRPAAETPAA